MARKASARGTKTTDMKRKDIQIDLAKYYKIHQRQQPNQHIYYWNIWTKEWHPSVEGHWFCRVAARSERLQVLNCNRSFLGTHTAKSVDGVDQSAKGDLEALKYVHENGFLWNELTCL